MPETPLAVVPQQPLGVESASVLNSPIVCADVLALPVVERVKVCVVPEFVVTRCRTGGAAGGNDIVEQAA